MPPAVALLNYISSGILWRIFCQTGTFRGVFSPYISFIKAGGISASIRELYCTFADFLPTSLSYIHLGSSVCHIPVCRPVIFLSHSCHSCGTLSYSLCFRNQADQGYERKDFEREGYRWRDRRWRYSRGRV